MSIFSKKSTNPVFTGIDKDLQSRDSGSVFTESSTDTFTIKGVAIKIVAAMVFIALLTIFMVANPKLLISIAGMYWIVLIICSIIAFVCVMVAVRSPEKAKFAFVAYTVAEGFLIAFLSAVFAEYAFTALLLTLCVVALTAIVYARNPEIVSDKFKAVVGISMAAVCGFYLISFLVSLFSGGYLIDFYSPLSIGISIVITIIVAARLMIDFQEIDNLRQEQVDKNYEWLSALGTLVTIIWLYLEILKLVIKLSRRR